MERTTIKIITIRSIPNPIHIGLNTQSHDHLINPVSFRTINAIVKSPVKPIPPEEVVVLLIISPIYKNFI